MRTALLTAVAAAAVAVVGLAAPAGAADTGLRAVDPGATSAARTATPAAVDATGPADLTGPAAASVGFAITGARCSRTDVVFSADTYETGRSGVRQLRQKGQLQEKVAGRWVVRSSVVTYTSTRFADDARSFHFPRSWDGGHAVTGRSWRVVWQGIYLNGTGRPVAQTKQIAVTC